MRDRTWSFRDEAAQWLEYAAVVGVFDGLFVTAMAAALLRGASLLLDDGTARTIEAGTRKAGFLVPMGSATDGSAFGAFDDFRMLECDGAPGAGFCEQGILHRVC